MKWAWNHEGPRQHAAERLSLDPADVDVQISETDNADFNARVGALVSLRSCWTKCYSYEDRAAERPKCLLAVALPIRLDGGLGR